MRATVRRQTAAGMHSLALTLGFLSYKVRPSTGTEGHFDMTSWIRTLWATAVLLFFFFGNAGGVFAKNIVYGTLDASLDTGSLEGTRFSVQYSYDADQVPPVGKAFVTLNSFDFTLLGVPFTRSDIFQGGQVILEGGVPQNVTASFQIFLPPGSPVRNVTFGFGHPLGIAYIDLNGHFGGGSFSFQPTQNIVYVRFDRQNVVAGSSYSATVSGSNLLTSQTFFDVRFRPPGSALDGVALNWQ